MTVNGQFRMSLDNRLSERAGACCRMAASVLGFDGSTLWHRRRHGPRLHGGTHRTPIRSSLHPGADQITEGPGAELRGALASGLPTPGGSKSEASRIGAQALCGMPGYHPRRCVSREAACILPVSSDLR